MRDFVEKNYFDEDLGKAVSRYAQSEEFSRICTILQPHLASGSRLLDIGAGRGLTSLALAQRGAHVISVESSAWARLRGFGGGHRCPLRRFVGTFSDFLSLTNPLTWSSAGVSCTI
jgi:hypothetical protein